MDLPSEQYKQWFVRNGHAPPAHIPHGITDSADKPLSSQMTRIPTHNWRLDGNQLIADTDQGRLVQNIPPEYICTGTDENGLPMLEKIKL